LESVFLVKFQTKEGAGYSSWKYVNESRRTCPVADCIWEELNITNACDCNRTTKQHEGVCPFTSIVKDQIAKARSFGIKCVSLVDINFDSFSSTKLYQQRISRPSVAMKKFTIFPRNLSCQRSYFRWKLIDVFFSAVSGMDLKICRDQSRLTFSPRGYPARACTPTWACSQASQLGSVETSAV